MDYVRLPALAPTEEMLDDYRKRRIDWNAYAARFLNLMRKRRIEATVPRQVLEEGCLLCSGDAPHHCHGRLVAEYLHEHWGGVETEHLRMSRRD